MLLETIKIKNNQLQRLDYHNQRLNYARKSLFQIDQYLDIAKVIQLPDLDAHTIYKCRVTYAQQIENVEISPYQIRPISTLKIIDIDNLDYSFKYTDRSLLTELFQQKSDCDDILMVKNGFVTDTYYCNIAVFDGQKWFTPSTPLLRGTQRQFLLDQYIIFEKFIKIKDLYNFQAIKLFNAMIDWDDALVVQISSLK